jgi:hypothetical protein
VSEKVVTRQQAGLVRRQTRAVGTPLISQGPALVENSLCPGQQEHTMRETEVQIGNSGLLEERTGHDSHRSHGLMPSPRSTSKLDRTPDGFRH